MESYSQYGQDKFVYESFFANKPDGVFVEIGADDGIDKSNTYFFEKIGWAGICIEPSPKRFTALKKNRNCHLENVAISNREQEVEFFDVTGYGKGLSGIVDEYHPKHVNRISRELENNPKTISKEHITVKAVTFNSICEKYNLPEIDYCSMDVEGGEVSILKSIDFNKVLIKVFTIEDPYNDKEMKRLMRQNKYLKIKNIGPDKVYVHQSMLSGWPMLVYKIRNFIFRLLKV